MPNLIPDVERIIAAKNRGYPEGASELWREIPVLLARITELENALVPFARVTLHETNKNKEDLVHVYYKHCIEARSKLDKSQGTVTHTDNFFALPAE